MNNLTSAKRRRTTTERYERLAEICEAYDNLSGPERQESLIDFLGQFALSDNIPKFNDRDLERNSDTEPSSDNDSQIDY